MQKVNSMRLVPTTERLRVTVEVAIGGGPIRSITYNVMLADLLEADVINMVEALNMEIVKRMKERWPDRPDTPLF